MFSRGHPVLLLLLGACGTGPAGDDGGVAAIDAAEVEIDAPAEGCTEVIGDLSLPIEVRPVFVDYRGEIQPIIDGGVGLIFPPQGGYVLMVGLEARNVRGCAATITGTVRDPLTGTDIAQEGRPTRLLLGADGWGHVAFPPTFGTANVATCPPSIAPQLPRDFDGSTWRLELVTFDETGRTGTWSGDIVPFCRPNAPDPEECPCVCDADYRFGQPCPVDPAPSSRAP